MSSDIYIPLSTVLSHPEHFQFNTAYNVGVEEARLEAASDQPDWYAVTDSLKPVLLCKFGARETWRYVDIDINEWGMTELHVPCGGDFRRWLMTWLDDHNYRYIII